MRMRGLCTSRGATSSTEPRVSRSRLPTRQQLVEHAHTGQAPLVVLPSTDQVTAPGRCVGRERRPGVRAGEVGRRRLEPEAEAVSALLVVLRSRRIPSQVRGATTLPSSSACHSVTRSAAVVKMPPSPPPTTGRWRTLVRSSSA